MCQETHQNFIKNKSIQIHWNMWSKLGISRGYHYISIGNTWTYIDNFGLWGRTFWPKTWKYAISGGNFYRGLYAIAFTQASQVPFKNFSYGTPDKSIEKSGWNQQNTEYQGVPLFDVDLYRPLIVRERGDECPKQTTWTEFQTIRLKKWL